MGFEQILRKTWRDNLLFSVLVELTYRCNLDCFFCYNDLGLRGEPLRTEQYLSFFEDLRDLQVLNLTLSGGEPLRAGGAGRVARHRTVPLRDRYDGARVAHAGAGGRQQPVFPFRQRPVHRLWGMRRCRSDAVSQARSGQTDL